MKIKKKTILIRGKRKRRRRRRNTLPKTEVVLRISNRGHKNESGLLKMTYKIYKLRE